MMPPVSDGHQLPTNKFVGVRMLCMDGGGSRGLAMAVIIEKLEEILNHDDFHYGYHQAEQTKVKLWQLFDLVAGTSTGGILAAAVGLKRLSGEECKELYVDLTKRVFRRSLRQRFRAFSRSYWYSNKNLKSLLNENFVHTDFEPKEENEFQSLRYNNTELPVVGVTSFDRTNEKSIIFSTTDNIINDVKVVDALQATSAAPTYFKASPIGDVDYVDGGLGANCPARMAVELVNDYWNPEADMSTPHPFLRGNRKTRSTELMISLGTGMCEVKPMKDKGSYLVHGFNWLKKFVQLQTDSQGIFLTVRKELKHSNPYCYIERLNPDTKGLGKLRLDSVETGKILGLTEEWLGQEKTDQIMWRNAYKLVAKNYYVDVNTEDIQQRVKGDRSPIVLPIRQRRDLFQISSGEFTCRCRVEGAIKKKDLESEVTTGILGDLELYITPSEDQDLREDIKVAVWYIPCPDRKTLRRKDGYRFELNEYTGLPPDEGQARERRDSHVTTQPDDVDNDAILLDDNNEDVAARPTDTGESSTAEIKEVQAEKTYLLAGCPFTIILYNSVANSAVEDNQIPGVPGPSQSVDQETYSIGHLEDITVSDRDLFKLSESITNEYSLMVLGINLEIPEYSISAALYDNMNDITMASFRVLKRWSNSQIDRRQEITKLSHAFMVIDQYGHFLKVFGRRKGEGEKEIIQNVEETDGGNHPDLKMSDIGMAAGLLENMPEEDISQPSDMATNAASTRGEAPRDLTEKMLWRIAEFFTNAKLLHKIGAELELSYNNIEVILFDNPGDIRGAAFRVFLAYKNSQPLPGQYRLLRSALEKIGMAKVASYLDELAAEEALKK